MSSNSCMCPCHTHSVMDTFCMLCAANHNNYFTTTQSPTDYSAMTFAVIQEIRDLLKDIKSQIIRDSDEPEKGKRRAKSGKTD